MDIFNTLLRIYQILKADVESVLIFYFKSKTTHKHIQSNF
jgi:hypothetical protein